MCHCDSRHLDQISPRSHLFPYFLLLHSGYNSPYMNYSKLLWFGKLWIFSFLDSLEAFSGVIEYDKLCVLVFSYVLKLTLKTLMDVSTWHWWTSAMDASRVSSYNMPVDSSTWNHWPHNKFLLDLKKYW